MHIYIHIYIYIIIHITYRSAKAATDSGDNRCPQRLHSSQHTPFSFFSIKGTRAITKEQHLFSLQQVLRPVRAKLHTSIRWHWLKMHLNWKLLEDGSMPTLRQPWPSCLQPTRGRRSSWSANNWSMIAGWYGTASKHPLRLKPKSMKHVMKQIISSFQVTVPYLSMTHGTKQHRLECAA